jgi:hypothetical protein
MLNTFLILFALWVLYVLYVREGFQMLIPISDLITEEKLVCKGAVGEQGPKGRDGVILTQAPQ